jgi:hypothetical protein
VGVVGHEEQVGAHDKVGGTAEGPLGSADLAFQ